MPGGPAGAPALGDVLGQMQKGSFFRLRRESNATQPPRMPGGAAGPGGEGAAGEVESARERMARKVGGPAPAPGGGPKAGPGGGGGSVPGGPGGGGGCVGNICGSIP